MNRGKKRDKRDGPNDIKIFFCLTYSIMDDKVNSNQGTASSRVYGQNFYFEKGKQTVWGGCLLKGI